jgi:hypothetical protein
MNAFFLFYGERVLSKIEKVSVPEGNAVKLLVPAAALLWDLLLCRWR